MSLPLAVSQWIHREYPIPQIDPVWLADCYKYVISTNNYNPATDLPAIKTAIEFELFHSDLSDSTRPGTGVPADIRSGNTRHLLEGPILVEVVAIDEKGVSAYELMQIRQQRINWDKLHEADNNDPTFLPGDEEDDRKPQYPRKTLDFVLSDGTREFKGIEINRFPDLDLAETPLGTKLVLRNVEVGFGIAKLTPRNTTVKGGVSQARQQKKDADFLRGLRIRLGLPVEPEDPPPQEANIDQPPPSPSPPPLPALPSRRPSPPVAAIPTPVTRARDKPAVSPYFPVASSSRVPDGGKSLGVPKTNSSELMMDILRAKSPKSMLFPNEENVLQVDDDDGDELEYVELDAPAEKPTTFGKSKDKGKQRGESQRPDGLVRYMNIDGDTGAREVSQTRGTGKKRTEVEKEDVVDTDIEDPKYQDSGSEFGFDFDATDSFFAQVDQAVREANAAGPSSTTRPQAKAVSPPRAQNTRYPIPNLGDSSDIDFDLGPRYRTQRKGRGAAVRVTQDTDRTLVGTASQTQTQSTPTSPNSVRRPPGGRRGPPGVPQGSMVTIPIEIDDSDIEVIEISDDEKENAPVRKRRAR